MKAPVWIQTTTLTKREAELVCVWMERVSELPEVDGGDMANFFEVNLPTLIALIDERYPTLSGSRKTTLLGKIMREQARAGLLVSEQAGRA